MGYLIRIYMGRESSFDLDEFASFHAPTFRYAQDPTTYEELVFDSFEEAEKVAKDIVAEREKLLESYDWDNHKDLLESMRFSYEIEEET